MHYQHIQKPKDKYKSSLKCQLFGRKHYFQCMWIRLCSLFGEFNPHLLKQVKKVLLPMDFPIDHIQTSASLKLRHYYLLEKSCMLSSLMQRKKTNKKSLKKTPPPKTNSNNNKNTLQYATGWTPFFWLDICLHGWVKREVSAKISKDFEKHF